MARPSKYNQALQKKFDDLVDSIGDIEIKTGDKRKTQITKLIEEFFTYGDINSLGSYLGVVTETIQDWRRENSDRYNKEFSATLKRWNTKRKAILFKITPFIDKSLAIFYNKSILKYVEYQGINLKTEVSQDINIRVKVDNLKENYGTEDLIKLDKILSQDRTGSVKGTSTYGSG